MPTEPKMLQIRRYRDSDSAAVRDLQAVSFRAAGVPERWLSAEDLNDISGIYLKGGDFLVGEIGGRLVAMGAFKKISGEIAEIKRIRVHPDFQRRGYASAIMAALEDSARRMGYSTVVLGTASSLPGAQQLYAKNGYREARREYSERIGAFAVFYEKDLRRMRP